MARAYRCFLAGDDPGAEAVDGEQAAAFGARSAETLERNQRLEQARPLPCVLRLGQGAQRGDRGAQPAPGAGTA